MFVVGVFAEHAVVAPEADDGVVGLAKMVKQAADLCIGEANRGVVAVDQPALEVGRDGASLRRVGVAAQLPEFCQTKTGVPSGRCCMGLISIVAGS